MDISMCEAAVVDVVHQQDRERRRREVCWEMAKSRLMSTSELITDFERAFVLVPINWIVGGNLVR